MRFRDWEKVFLAMSLLICFITMNSNVAQAKKDEKKVILYVPQDDRPISSDQTADAIRAMGYTVQMPPKGILGDRDREGRPEDISRWLMQNADDKTKVAVISTDAMVYGSLVASRKHHIPKEMLMRRVDNIEKLHNKFPDMPIYMFTSIMRTPQDGAASGTEEPDYYVQYGREIANYTKVDNADTSGLDENYQVALRQGAYEAALADWMQRRKNNLQISARLMNLVRNGSAQYMVMGKDDNSKFSQTHKESIALEQYADRIGLGSDKFQVLTGLDEIGLLTLMRMVDKLENNTPYVFVKYASGLGGATVPSYSDEPVDETLTDQIRTIGGVRTYNIDKADLVMMINTNRSGWTYDANTPVNTLQPRYNTLSFVDDIDNLIANGYHVSIGDIAFANGSDNALMYQLQKADLLDKLYGYAGWNTPTNSTGFALGLGIIGTKVNQEQRDKLLLTRYLDDWVYQANIRQNVNSYINLLPGAGDYLTIGDTKLPFAEERGTELMRAFAGENLSLFANAVNVSITMPWNRIFEANISLDHGAYDDTILKKRLARNR